MDSAAQQLLQFVHGLEQLREFLGFVRPQLQARVEEVVSANRVALLPLAPLLVAAGVGAKGESPQIGDAIEKAEQGIGGGAKFHVEQGILRSVTLPKGSSAGFVSALRKIAIAFNHERHLVNTTLVSLCSVIEVFVSGQLHLFFAKRPGAANLDEFQLSLSDLERYGAIEVARQSLVAKRVESVVRGSVEDWLDFLEKKMNLKSAAISDERMFRIVELFQRRNVLVHAGGLVNGIYLANVSKGLSKDLKQGDEIVTTVDYLLEAISLCEAVFLLMAIELWRQLEPNNEGRVQYVVDTAESHALLGRWALARELFDAVVNDKSALDAPRLFARLGALNCRLKTGDVAAKDELIQMDLSSSAMQFELMRQAALGVESEVLKLTRRVLSEKQVEVSELRGWSFMQPYLLNEAVSKLLIDVSGAVEELKLNIQLTAT